MERGKKEAPMIIHKLFFKMADHDVYMMCVCVAIKLRDSLDDPISVMVK